MANRVTCQNCGAAVTLPAGYARGKIRCPGCGYYAEVPPELRGNPAEPAVVAQTDPRETAPRRGGRPPVPAVSSPFDDPDPDSSAGGYEPLAEEKYGLADAGPPPAAVSRPGPPPARKGRKARQQSDPRDFRPKFDPDDPDNPGGAPLLAGTRDEDDDKPYGVHGTGVRHCPQCRGELPLDATLCVHCGRDLGTGERAGRVFQPITAEWHEGWSPLLRLQFFVAFQVVNVVATVMLLVTGTNSLKSPSDVASMVFVQGFQTALQAFLLGSFDTLFVKRTAKGQASVNRVRRLAFIKLPPAKLPWKRSTNVGIAGTDVGLFPKMLCLYFFINGAFYTVTGVFYSAFMFGLAVLNLGLAAGFYWLVVRPDRFVVTLCDVHGATDEIAFRCQDRAQADEVATLLTEATGLIYKPVV